MKNRIVVFFLLAMIVSAPSFAQVKSEFLSTTNINAPDIGVISLMGLDSAQRIRICHAMCVSNQSCKAFSLVGSTCNLKGTVLPNNFVYHAGATSGTIR